MHYSRTFNIDAPAERVWSILADVERWPEWTTSMSSVARLDQGAFGVGSRARIKQPGFPSAIWTVTDMRPGRSFTWTSTAAGVTSVAEHLIEPGQSGSATVTLTLEQRGMLARLIELLAAKRIREYVDLEAEGLKRRSQEKTS